MTKTKRGKTKKRYINKKNRKPVVTFTSQSIHYKKTNMFYFRIT